MLLLLHAFGAAVWCCSVSADLGCIVSGLLLMLPLPVSFRAYIEAAPLHLFMLLLLLGLLTGGSSSVLLFTYGDKCIRGLAATLNICTRRFLGFALLLPQQEQQHKQQLVLLAETQLTATTTAAAAAKTRKRPLTTLQLSKAFRLDEGEVLLLHSLSDFSPLEETQLQHQQAAASKSKSVLQRLGSAAAAAFRVASPTSRDSKGGTAAAAAIGDNSSSSLLRSLFPAGGWRVLLQQVLQQVGLVASPSMLYVVATGLRYAPQLLLLLLPSFLLGPLLVLLLRVWPLIGTLVCLSKRGSVSSRLYWLCYFWGAAAAYNTHTRLAEHALLRLLPLQQTRLLLLLWGVQTAAKVLSHIAKLDPPEPPALHHQQQQQQQQVENNQRTVGSKRSSIGNGEGSSSSSSSSSNRSSSSTVRRRC